VGAARKGGGTRGCRKTVKCTAGFARRPCFGSLDPSVMSAKKKPPQPTASPAGKSAAKAEPPAERAVAENRKARHDYEIIDTLECGIALVGSEVKSLRTGRMSLDEAYGRVEGTEVWLYGCDIPEYEKANQLNHKPKRPRKLLLHRREIRGFAAHAFEKGLTLVPLKAYFKRGRVKVLLGIGRGRKAHDKREKLKAATARREIEIALRGRSRGGR